MRKRKLAAAGEIVDFSFGPPELSEVFVRSVGRAVEESDDESDEAMAAIR